MRSGRPLVSLVHGCEPVPVGFCFMLVNKLKAGGHRRHVGKLYAHGNGNSSWTELILNYFAWLFLLTEPWRIGAQRPRSGSGKRLSPLSPRKNHDGRGVESAGHGHNILIAGNPRLGKRWITRPFLQTAHPPTLLSVRYRPRRGLRDPRVALALWSLAVRSHHRARATWRGSCVIRRSES